MKADFLKKWPSKSQWGQFLKTLSKREIIVFSSSFVVFVISILFLFLSFYYSHTEIIASRGGIYMEGVLGSPRFINPIYAAASDVDRDLTELTFAGLLKYDADGKIIPDLAQEYKILENGRIYEFYLRDDLKWSDGNEMSAEDVVFTVKTIQNPDYKSPLRANWLGVNVEKVSNSVVRFELKNPSAVFLENCTLKILPKKIWEEITAENFPFSVYNLKKPLGSGPYKVKSVTQADNGNIGSIELITNPFYYGDLPYISQINFKFFNNEESLIKAFNAGQIQGFSILSVNKLKEIGKSFSEYRLLLPRYFAIFFNPEKLKLFEDKNLRMALNYGTDKKEIIEKILNNEAELVSSPALPEIYGLENTAKEYEFNIEEAEKLLDKTGYLKNENGIREKITKKTPAFQLKSNLVYGSQGTEVKELQKCLAGLGPEIYPEGEANGNFGEKTKAAVIRFQEKYRDEILVPAELDKGNGEVKQLTREKLNQLCFSKTEEKSVLKISLTTVDQPLLTEVAQMIKDQWKKMGIEVEIKVFDVSTLEKEIIKPRNYDSLLFGEVLGAIPDPFPFWHSSQKKDPGLNIAYYDNKKCDALLEEARQTTDELQRIEKLEEFQKLLTEDAPAVFLYAPDYIYIVSKDIKGISTKIIVDPSKRFANIFDWHIKTKRSWKW